MKSRITIDFDENFKPVIQVDYRESDDVRDKFVKSFMQLFGHESAWAKVRFSERVEYNNIGPIITGRGDVIKQITISPIPPSDIESEAIKILEGKHSKGLGHTVTPVFVMTVNDQFCTWEYGINVSEESDACIKDVIDAVCEKFNAKVTHKKLVEGYVVGA